MSEIKELDDKYVAKTYSRFPVEIVLGKGSILVDVNGKKYIDMGSGIGVSSFGIADDVWIKAVESQISLVQHTSNLYYTAPCAKLAEMLCKKTGFSRVFFSNSGAEANECAIKVARKWAGEKKGGEYYNIITLRNSFHGRTLTTLAATGQDVFHKLYTPLTPGFLCADADISSVNSLIKSNKVAAVLIECIQGEGGLIPLDSAFIKQLRTLTRDNDILLIIDEVQTGNGRTGELYSYMNFSIEPDIISTAKGLAGGLPLGATLMSKELSGVFGPSDHGSTFGGNPVCCQAAISILERIDNKLLIDVKRKGEYIKKAFEGAKGVKSVTGMGLMLGIETEKDASSVINKCIEEGVLCLRAKNKVRLLPALNIPDNVLKSAVEIIKNCIK